MCAGEKLQTLPERLNPLQGMKTAFLIMGAQSLASRAYRSVAKAPLCQHFCHFACCQRSEISRIWPPLPTHRLQAAWPPSRLPRFPPLPSGRPPSFSVRPCTATPVSCPCHPRSKASCAEQRSEPSPQPVGSTDQPWRPRGPPSHLCSLHFTNMGASCTPLPATHGPNILQPQGLFTCCSSPATASTSVCTGCLPRFL